MNKNIKDFLDFGIYKNNMYFPNNYVKTKEYINNLSPLINEIKNVNKSELINYIEDNDINIYSLSICISILGLDHNTFQIISKEIFNHKQLFVFLWIYTIINPIKKNKYLNMLYLNNIKIVENNISDLFKIYKPSYSVRQQINRKLKEKYKIRYIIESQDNFDNLLDKIKQQNITPDDLKVEMGFTFEPSVKNSIIIYFIENFDTIKVLHLIDKWFMDHIPNEILEKLEEKIENLNDIRDIYELLVLNTSLEHIELTNIINEQIKLLEGSNNTIKLNINYMPNMKINMKWDKLHTYNSYISTIISILNENFDTFVNLKEKNISTKITYDLYNTLLNNTTFSLDKASEIQKTNNLSLLFSNEYSNGYDILWDVTNDNSPLYLQTEYLLITGKNEILMECFIKYVYALNNKKKKVIKKDKKVNTDIYKETLSDNIVDDLEESIDIIKDTLNNVKFNIKRV